MLARSRMVETSFHHHHLLRDHRPVFPLVAPSMDMAFENDFEPPPLRADPTIAQIRQHAKESTKKHKALACLQNGVTDVIFTQIMACRTPTEAWERLKEEFMGSAKTKQQQLINLRRDFENLKIRESETIKLLGEDFSESRVVEKVITTLLERFESKISSLEDSRDLSTISLSELINSLHALEQRRANRQEDHPEGAFQGKAKESSSTSQKGKKRYPPCVHYKKTIHSEKFCWFRPDIQCRKCQQYGHIEKDVKKQKILDGVDGIAEKLSTSTTDELSSNFSLLNKRKYVYEINKFETEAKGFLAFVWDALQDITLIILGVYTLVSLIVGIIMEGWPKETHDGLWIVTSILLVMIVTVTCDYRHSMKFKNLDKKKKKEETKQRRSVEALACNATLNQQQLMKIGSNEVEPDAAAVLGAFCYFVAI
ncbi:hypothetical protein J1N35_015273 [Gossypium stocksii]|uniref:Cation-transporting P-type ATPase N-terminal domain-containing protein n=1 Tax=Gossypium stocksii TaxID=47602 RepID=A0A9D3VVZ5_9ROSI|nr:hypothetical protein J1N35_015273 [Gossypium stocksii]